MNNSPNPKISPEKYAYLKAEAQAPYKGLRKFVYLGLAASGLIGGMIFLLQILAGRGSSSVLTNLALQISVVVLMIYLFRLESD